MRSEEFATKKILVALGKKLLARVQLIARTDERTRAEVIREALRFYCDAHARGLIGSLPSLSPQAAPTTLDELVGAEEE